MPKKHNMFDERGAAGNWGLSSEGNAQFASIKWNTAMDVNEFSEKATRLFGWCRDEMTSDLGTMYHLSRKQDHDLLKKIANDLVNEGSQPISIRLLTITKSGKAIWCDWHNSVIKDEEDHIVSIMSLIRKVDERHAGKAGMDRMIDSHNSELSVLNKIMDSSLDIICTINGDGDFDYVSQAADKIWGYQPEELRGRKYMDFVVDEDKEMTLTAAADIVNGRLVTVFENHYRHRTGIVMPMLWSARWDAKDKLMYCIAKDLTEKNNLQKTLDAERSRFYKLFLQAPSCMAIVRGPDHVYEMANPLYLSLIGKENILGKRVADVLPTVTSREAVELLDYVYQTGTDFSASEICLKVESNVTGILVDKYVNFLCQVYKDKDDNIEGIFFFINEITEQFLSQKMIEKSERQYRRIVDTTQDGIWMIDRENVTTFVNGKLCEMMGYTEEELVGTDTTLFNGDGNELAGCLTALKLTGKADVVDLSLLTKSGSKIWIRLSGTAIFSNDGAYDGALWMMKDITEKRKAQQELLSERLKLTEAQAIARLGSWEHDPVTGIRILSAEACRICGLTPEECMLPYDEWLKFIHPDDLKKVLAVYELSFTAHSETGVEHRIILRDQSIRHIFTTSKYQFDNKQQAVRAYGIMHDITDRKTANANLRISESNLREAQAIAHMGNWSFDLQKNIHLYSDQLFVIFGLDNATFQPGEASLLALVHPEDITVVRKALQEASTDNVESYLEFRFIRSDGETRYAYAAWKFELDYQGKPIRIFGILKDVTESKLIEMERGRMLSAITLRNKELEQFSFIISHNLRAPVANILGASQTMKHVALTPEDKAILSEGLHESVLKLDDVIKDLNQILQTKNNKDISREKVIFSQLIDDIKLSIAKIADSKPSTIRYDFSEIGELVTTKSYLYSIFYNLVSNSLKYSRPNITPVVDIKSRRGVGSVVITFQDNGMGINLKKYGDQVFGLYKRFNTGIDGKGMGLFMTKAQVELLGGAISLTSEPDKGTLFTIELYCQ